MEPAHVIVYGDGTVDKRGPAFEDHSCNIFPPTKLILVFHGPKNLHKLQEKIADKVQVLQVYSENEPILNLVPLKLYCNLKHFRCDFLYCARISLKDLLSALPNPKGLKVLGFRTTTGPSSSRMLNNVVNTFYYGKHDIILLSEFTSLEQLYLEVVFYPPMDPGETRSWLTKRNYSRDLAYGISDVQTLHTVSIVCPYLEITWEGFACENIEAFTGIATLPPLIRRLELDTGLHNRFKSLMVFDSLNELYYSFYGDYFEISFELDHLQLLLERNSLLRYICLKVPEQITNRTNSAMNLVKFGQDWQAVTFYFASYYDEYYDSDGSVSPANGEKDASSGLSFIQLSHNVFMDAFPEELKELRDLNYCFVERGPNSVARSLSELPSLF